MSVKGGSMTRLGTLLKAALAFGLIASLLAITPGAADAGTEVDLGGDVTFEDGSSADGVRATLFEAVNPHTRGRYLGSDTTGDYGRFSFRVEHGCYIVVTIAPQGTSFQPDADDMFDQQYGCTTGEQNYFFDSVLYRPGSDNARVGGTVNYDDGQAAEGIRSTLFVAKTPYTRGKYLGSTESDNIGNFSFVVPGGCYIIVTIAAPDTSFGSADSGRRYNQQYGCVAGGGINPTFDSVLFRTGPVDTEPPVGPTNLTVRGDLKNAMHIIVQWPAATDNVAVTGYRLYRDGSFVEEVSADARDYVYRDLTPETFYTLSVSAVDAAGNESTPASGSETTRALPTAGNEAINLFWKENGAMAAKMEVSFNVQEIGPSSNMFFSQQFRFNTGSSGYFGLQQQEGVRRALISFWSSQADSDIGKVIRYDGPANVEDDCGIRPDEPGIFDPFSCITPFDWQEGTTYVLTLTKGVGSPEDQLIGAWWNASISGGGDTFDLGDFLIRRPDGQDQRIIDTATFLEEFTVDPFCQVPPLTVLEVGNPQFNGGASAAVQDLALPGDCTNGNSVDSDFFPEGGRTLSMGR